MMKTNLVDSQETKPCVFIHVNHKQILGAHVGEQSIRRASKHNDKFDVKFIETKDNEFMLAREGDYFLRNDRLLDLVEAFVGPEITCSPIQHIRAKLPTRIVSDGDAEAKHVAPWHQDAGDKYDRGNRH